MTGKTKVAAHIGPRGLRIPRTLLEEAGLKGAVEILIEPNRLIIQSAQVVRQGWDTRFALMAQDCDDRILDEPTPTPWDEDEWEW